MDCTVLTIDPGILNLSACIMTCTDKKNLETYNIELWNVYDVIDAENYNCEGLQKSGKICGKKCGYKYKSDDLKIFIYCCKSHFPKNIKIEKCNIFKKKLISTYLLHDIAKSIITKIQELYNDNKENFQKVNHVIIELQPGFNKKMVFVSHIIYGKLTELYRDTNTTIKFVRASQKLRAYTGEPIECKLKGAYPRRKFLSVKYGYWFLENKFNQEQRELWKPILDDKKVKADDKTDVFLMAINSLFGINKKQLTNFKNDNMN